MGGMNVNGGGNNANGGGAVNGGGNNANGGGAVNGGGNNGLGLDLNKVLGAGSNMVPKKAPALAAAGEAPGLAGGGGIEQILTLLVQLITQFLGGGALAAGDKAVGGGGDKAVGGGGDKAVGGGGANNVGGGGAKAAGGGY
jgi:hypothetical protein